MAGLRTYKSKRDFSHTAEPEGAARTRRGRSVGGTFCVQKHAARRLHFDLRLEMDGVLKSWAVPKGPSLDPRVRRLAVHVEDHPLDYGSFEGVIPKGEYGGGTVMLWDEGSWTPDGDGRRGYEAGELKFKLSGHKLRGGWALIRTAGRGLREGGDGAGTGSGGDGTAGDAQWLLVKERDEWARPGEPDPWGDDDRSVASRRTMAELARGDAAIWSAQADPLAATAHDGPPAATAQGARPAAKARLPSRINASLATLVDEPPNGDDWLHEIKYDGYRILARLQQGKVRLFTRNAQDWTARYPAVARALADLPATSAWLDGEIVAFDKRGVSDFEALQQALSEGRYGELTYMVFDLLYLDGNDLRRLPLVERKERLAGLLADGSGGPERRVRLSEHLQGHGRRFFAEACRHDLEGVVCKRAGSGYAGRRSRAWVKCKCGRRQELVIGGYTEPRGSREGFGALLLGVYEGSELRYAGRVGTGFDDATLNRLAARLRAAERRTAPFRDPPRGAQARGVHWVTPRLVAEVTFAEWTSDGLLRQPVFKGLRSDKPARTVRRESSGTPAGAGRHHSESSSAERPRARRARRPTESSPVIAGVTITHPDRVVYAEAGYTKLDVVHYYQAVADLMLPYLADRPLTIIRCPDGTSRQCFFQKHPTTSLPGDIKRVTVKGAHGSSKYPVVDSVASLIAMVQLGTVEFHVRGSRAGAEDVPDQILFDLDPDDGVPWRRVRAAARELRAELLNSGLQSLLKTSGGKGLHVIVPIRPEWPRPRVAEVARDVVETLVAREPQKYTGTMSKAKRTGKVFIDHFRNSRGATAVVPYSLRARLGAPVALPLDWDELSRTAGGDAYTLKRALRRVRARRRDPWAEFQHLGQRQSLPRARAS
jgi:bifunctional non-homologous end joining protein LigD